MESPVYTCQAPGSPCTDAGVAVFCAGPHRRHVASRERMGEGSSHSSRITVSAASVVALDAAPPVSFSKTDVMCTASASSPLM